MNNKITRNSLKIVNENGIRTEQRSFRKNLPSLGILFSLMLLFSSQIYSQTTQNVTIPSGSFIVNMGVTPQTIANGLKPYGMLYALLEAGCPVHWVINPGKTKDGADFTYNNIAYKGGPFIIEAKYRTSAVNAIISTWTNPLGIHKVVGITTTSPVTVPVYLTFSNVPRWTLDLKNGSIATTFFANAGIPATAYGGASSNWELPSQLDCCDDIFVMPHADPIWSTHGHLWAWVQSTGNGTNTGCKSGVWLGCHAGSALEDMFNPANPVQQTNFLADKEIIASGTGPYFQNALTLWGNHGAGTLPYSYDYHSDPIMQFLGIIDAATQNGSEQIYIPRSKGWYPNTHVGVFDPDHPQRYPYAAPYTGYTDPKHRPGILAYGPAFGVTGNGKIMLEASHSISKLGDNPASVAAQRAFFNYSFLVAWEKGVVPEISTIPSVVYSGQSYNLSYAVIPNIAPAAAQSYTTKWTSSCGGTFSPNDTSAAVTFTPATAASPTPCIITLTVVDACGRTSFDNQSIVVECNMSVSTSIVNPCYNTPNGGAINMTFTNGTGPFIWTWTKTGGGSGSGSGTTISGLSAGTYTVTATANNGAGCPVTFTVDLTLSPQIIITATPVPIGCYGDATGSINTSVSGGVPGYTYLWADGPTTANRSNLAIGTYNLTVTDSKGCVASTSVTITQPDAISITPTVTHVTCYGQNNGIVDLVVTGGIAPYTYLWSDGNSSQNHTGLAPGTYSVTVTDANNCTQTLSGISVTQPAAALTLSTTQINVACYGSSTGSVNLTPTGGTSPYSFAWTGPGAFSSNLEDISGLTAGTYNVTVTDSKGCTANLSATITQVPDMVLSAVSKQPTCPPVAPQKNSDGTITLSVTNGTPGYTYSWTGPNSFTSISKDLTGVIAGTYTVTVTDSNGCIKSTSVTLTYLNPILPPPGSITQ